MKASMNDTSGIVDELSSGREDSRGMRAIQSFYYSGYTSSPAGGGTAQEDSGADQEDPGPG